MVSIEACIRHHGYVPNAHCVFLHIILWDIHPSAAKMMACNVVWIVLQEAIYPLTSKSFLLSSRPCVVCGSFDFHLPFRSTRLFFQRKAQSIQACRMDEMGSCKSLRLNCEQSRIKLKYAPSQLEFLHRTISYVTGISESHSLLLLARQTISSSYTPWVYHQSAIMWGIFFSCHP